MTKIADVVKDAVSQLTAAVKDIKQSDEDDLAQLAEKFDQLSVTADEIAGRLSHADQALTGARNGSADEPAEAEGTADDQQ